MSQVSTSLLAWAVSTSSSLMRSATPLISVSRAEASSPARFLAATSAEAALRRLLRVSTSVSRARRRASSAKNSFTSKSECRLVKAVVSTSGCFCTSLRSIIAAPEKTRSARDISTLAPQGERNRQAVARGATACKAGNAPPRQMTNRAAPIMHRHYRKCGRQNRPANLAINRFCV